MFSEARFLESLVQLFGGNQGTRLNGSPEPTLELGVEALDDAAVIAVQDTSIIVATDFVRGPRFNLFKKGLLSHRDLGWYLAAANMSDIAAMGAAPSVFLPVVRLAEPEFSSAEALEVLGGAKAACDRYGVVVVGGDTGTYEVPVLSGTALGFVQRGRYLRRSAAKAGQHIYVGGQIGLAGTCLIYFMKRQDRNLKLTDIEESLLLQSWKQPQPRIELGCALAHSGLAGACQDISDGLRRTLEQMATASGVQFAIEASRIPIHELTYKLASQLDIDPLIIAFGDSVDFSLAFTLDPLPIEELQALNFPSPVVQIGTAMPGNGCVLIRESGSVGALPGVPWDQQTEDTTLLLDPML